MTSKISLLFLGGAVSIIPALSFENSEISQAQEKVYEIKSTIPFATQNQQAVNKPQQPSSFSQGTGFGQQQEQTGAVGGRARVQSRGSFGTAQAQAGFGSAAPTQNQHQQPIPDPSIVDEVPINNINDIVDSFRNKICAVNKDGMFEFTLKAGIQKDRLVVSESSQDGGLKVSVKCGH